jgi:hypothetical protein
VLGTWSAATYCELGIGGMADLTNIGIGCTSAPVMGSLRVSGTWVAMDDGTYADDTTTAGEVTLALSQECLTISGFMTTCDRMGSPLAGLGLNSAVCVDDATSDGCACAATINQSGGMASISVLATTSGTYTTEDTKLVMNASDVDTEYRYCVDGDALTMAPGAENGIGTLTGPVVLQRQ